MDEEVTAKISVIIPVYNSGNYLHMAINSLRQQTCGFHQLQVILVDDGSTDDSLTIERQFSNRYSNIEVIPIEHGGASMARNAGLEKARGELIEFLDSDDTLQPQFFQYALEYADRFPDCDAFYFPIDIYSYNGRFPKKSKLYDVSVEALPFNIGNCASTVFRLKAIRDAQISFHPNVIFGEDGWFTTEVICQKQKVCAVSHNVFYEYHRRNDSVSTQKQDRFVNQVTSLTQLLWEIPRQLCEKYHWFQFPKYLTFFLQKKVDYYASQFKTAFHSDTHEDDAMELATLLRDADFDFTHQLPYLSIIMPLHECDTTLGDVIQALYKQTLRNWELICVDDREDDNIWQMMSPYLYDTRISYVKNTTPMSAGLSRNIGLQHARGQFVWFIDSDDTLPFDGSTLQRLFDRLCKRNSDICVIRTQMIKDGSVCSSFLDKAATNPSFMHKTITPQDLQESAKYKSFFQCALFNPWNKIFAHRFLFMYQHYLKFQNVPFSNDVLFACKAFDVFETMTFDDSDEVLYSYHRRSSSTSSWKNRSEHLRSLGDTLNAIAEIDFRDKMLKMALIRERLEQIPGFVGNVAKFRGVTIQSIEKELKPYIQPVLLKVKSSIYNTRGMLGRLMGVENKTSEPVEPVKQTTALSSIPKVGSCKHDAVFILGDGSTHRDMELLLAMTSLKKFCPFVNRVFVVGSKPRCNLSELEYTYIPCRDPYTRNKDANIMFKVLHAIDNIPDLTDDFLLCSDDQLVTQPCTWDDFKPKYVKRITEEDIQEMKRRKSNDWTTRLIKTLEEVNATGRKTWFYEPHIWSPINKVAFKNMINSIGGLRNATVIFTQYYNSIDHLDHEPLHDHKSFASYSMDWGESLKGPPKFIAYNEKAFCNAEFREQLVLLLK